MAHIGGPISSLPGTLLKLPENQTCDDHPDRLAVVRVQAETDSFGYEAIDWCEECYEKYQKEKTEGDGGSGITSCDHCHAVDCKTTATRDPDEGSCGPVYHLCDSCLQRLRDYHNDN